MSRYVAFLRGMNLGGRRITNDDLRSHFEALECEDVATFRASGNVIFAVEGESPAKLTARLEDGLAEALGYEAPVFLRTAKEIAAIAAHEPFDGRERAGSDGKLQVAMLAKKPAAAAARKALAHASKEDRLALEKRELYWLPAGRMSDSELDLKALHTLLGPMTIRTESTIEQIAEKYFSR
jgi:uncharacterized protein (DUF1697 family)